MAESDEMRLIDADTLREDWLQNGENEYVYDTNSFLSSLDNAPTIDPETLPIVRQLREELARVTAERGAAVNDLRGCSIESCTECMYCRYKTARSFCWDCTDGSNWAYRGPQKEE